MGDGRLKIVDDTLITMIIIGHRGARGLAPENTITSLLKGIEHKADEVEFDVRVTADGIPVLHHDPEITDPSGTKLAIVHREYDTLLQHKADLATLAEVFAQLPNSTKLVIEIKPHVSLHPITKVLQQALNNGWNPNNLAIASFDFTVLRAMHHAFPDIDMIVNERWSGVRAHYRARAVKAKRVTMNQMWLWSGFIKSVSSSNIQLVAYTLNDPVKVRRWARYGLTGIVTDYPDRFER